MLTLLIATDLYSRALSHFVEKGTHLIDPQSIAPAKALSQGNFPTSASKERSGNKRERDFSCQRLSNC